MDQTHSDAEMHARGAGSTSRIHMHIGGDEEARDSGPTTLDGLREVARSSAERARSTLGGRLGAIAEAVDERTGLITAARERPLAALGLAFSAGYLLAQATADEEGNWLVERARRQLKALIMTSLGALVAHEVRHLAGDEGLGSVIQGFLNDDGEDDFDL